MENQTPNSILPSSWLPYVLHLRPRAWPIVGAHLTVGFLLANGFDFSKETLPRLLLALLCWAVLGNGGTLAINSAYDRDTGDIGYLDNPPPVPKHLGRFAVIVLLSGFPLAILLGPQFLIAYSICFILSLLYSVPPFRGKSRAGIDVLINSTGFGALTIYAGWAVMATSFQAPIGNVMAGFFFLFAAFYPLTQIYQMKEDHKRGDVTMALLLGKAQALNLSIAAVMVAFLFFLGEAFFHFRTLQSLSLAGCLLLWLILLISWRNNYASMDTAHEKQGFYRGLWIWAATDICIVLSLAPLF